MTDNETIAVLGRVIAQLQTKVDEQIAHSDFVHHTLREALGIPRDENGTGTSDLLKGIRGLKAGVSGVVIDGASRAGELELLLLRLSRMLDCDPEMIERTCRSLVHDAAERLENINEWVWKLDAMEKRAKEAEARVAKLEAHPPTFMTVMDASYLKTENEILTDELKTSLARCAQMEKDNVSPHVARLQLARVTKERDALKVRVGELDSACRAHAQKNYDLQNSREVLTPQPDGNLGYASYVCDVSVPPVASDRCDVDGVPVASYDATVY